MRFFWFKFKNDVSGCFLPKLLLKYHKSVLELKSVLSICWSFHVINTDLHMCNVKSFVQVEYKMGTLDEVM